MKFNLLETTNHTNNTNKEREILFKKESYRIIGACFEVYNDKGNGFLEAVYQECLKMEFGKQKITFIEKPKLESEYKGQKLSQSYEPDFFCFNKIIFELKAVKSLSNEHRAQVFNYLKATELKIGLLINFGSEGLENKRLF